MWMIKLKGGIEMTEKELRYWDNVPKDAEIEAVGIAIPREGGQEPYIVDLRGFDRICLAKVGSAVGGGPGKITGFAAFGVKGESVTEFMIGLSGVSLKAYPIASLTLKPEALRDMVNGV